MAVNPDIARGHAARRCLITLAPMLPTRGDRLATSGGTAQPEFTARVTTMTFVRCRTPCDRSVKTSACPPLFDNITDVRQMNEIAETEPRYGATTQQQLRGGYGRVHTSASDSGRAIRFAQTCERASETKCGPRTVWLTRRTMRGPSLPQVLVAVRLAQTWSSASSAAMIGATAEAPRSDITIV